MSKTDTNPAPAEEPRLSGSPTPPGSPSSDTPETDAFSQRLTAAKVPVSRTCPHWYDYAANLERERDEARREAEDKRDIIEEMISDRYTFPWENAATHAPGANEKPLK